jgi:group I intron endonuclease
MAAIVYLATNRVNGKRYVGVTGRGFDFRRRQHETAPNSKTVTCRYFHAAIKKYGPDAFEWSVLATCETFHSALAEEVRLIAEMKPEYNLTAGGQGATGAVFSEERRAKISAALLGKPKSEEHRRNSGLARKGIKSSPEAIEKRRQKALGRPCSSEHREKIRATLRGRKRPPEVVAKMLASRAIRYSEKPWLELGITYSGWSQRRRKAREAANGGV